MAQAPLLPVELRHVNHTASTNGWHSKPAVWRQPYNGSTQVVTMADTKHLDQIAERVERLLLRHEELQRTNALLQEQVLALQNERDTLKSRLNAARGRIDALLDRLPAIPGTSTPAGDADSTSAREERA